MPRLALSGLIGLFVVVVVVIALRDGQAQPEPSTSSTTDNEPSAPRVTREADASGPIDEAGQAPPPNPAFGLPPVALQRSPVKVDYRKVGNGDNVFVGQRQYTDFPNPHHLDAEVSPSGAFLFVNHRDFGPWKTSVYEVESGRRLATFETGFGGVAGWAAYDLLYNTHGCGTNCSMFYVYDLQGNERWKTFHGSLDPSGRHVIVEPYLLGTSEVRVHDVRDGTLLGQATLADVLYAQQPEWIDGRTLLIRYEVAAGDPDDEDAEQRQATLVIEPPASGD